LIRPRRLATQPGRRPRLGLALGSGAARGLAHIGVLKALSQHNVPIDYLAGSSVGAVVGALFAAGYPVSKLIEVGKSMSIGRLARPTLSRRGLSSSQVVEDLVVSLIGDLDFNDLPIPLTVVATDLRTGREVYLDSGRVALAVRASAGFIGVYAPVEIGGVPLVDGGVAMASPVGPVRAMGADVVVAVDVIPSVVFSSFPDNIFSIVTRTLDILIKRAEKPSIDQADFVIEPLSGDVGSFEFDRVEQLVALGNFSTLKVLAPLGQALNLRIAAIPMERQLEDLAGITWHGDPSRFEE